MPRPDALELVMVLLPAASWNGLAAGRTRA